MNNEKIINLCNAMGSADFDSLAAEPGLDADLSAAMQSVHAKLVELRKEADTDYLTGAWNRRYFFRRVDEILDGAKQNGTEEFRAALLIYDLDDFKKYNDEFGHWVGDEILRDTAKLINTMCRSHDVVARVGGDEFAAFLWDRQPRRENSQPLRNAYELADRFRQAITALKPASLVSDAQGKLTISGGLAIWPANGENCESLLRAADNALLKAKSTGKNTIMIVGQ